MSAPIPLPPPPGAGLTPAKRSQAPLIIGLCVVVLAGAGGWFGYQYWKKRGEGQAKQEQTAQVVTPPVVSTPVESAPVVSTPVVSTPVETKPLQTPYATPVGAIPPRTTSQSLPQSVPQRTVPARTPPVAAAEPAPPPVVTTAPATPAREEPPPPQTPPPPARSERTPVFQPERTYPTPSAAAAPAAPAAPRYSGPASGVIVWSGQLEGGAAVTIDGINATSGTVNGSLPGVPVLIEVSPAEVAISEAPSPGNGWKRFSVRSRKNRHTVVTIRWRVL